MHRVTACVLAAPSEGGNKKLRFLGGFKFLMSKASSWICSYRHLRAVFDVPLLTSLQGLAGPVDMVEFVS